MLNFGFNDNEIQDFFNSNGIKINELSEETKKTFREYIEHNKKIMIEKKNYNYVRYIIWKLFSPILIDEKNEGKLPITEEEKNKLIDLIKDNLEYLSFIFEFLNKGRDKINELSKDLFCIVIEIFMICINYVLQNIGNCSTEKFKQLVCKINILSKTFFYNENGSKKYINELENFEKHELLKNVKYWKCMFS